MFRSILEASALAILVPAGAMAQAHQHGATSQQDSSQAASMQMHEHMQTVQQMMQQMMQMHGEQGGQGMGRQGMQGMSPTGPQAMQGGTCIMSGPRAGVSAFLLGSSADLALTEAQRIRLEEILDGARNDALQALTPEQRQKLETAPALPPSCPMAPQTSSLGSIER